MIIVGLLVNLGLFPAILFLQCLSANLRRYKMLFQKPGRWRTNVMCLEKLLSTCGTCVTSLFCDPRSRGLLKNIYEYISCDGKLHADKLLTLDFTYIYIIYLYMSIGLN